MDGLAIDEVGMICGHLVYFTAIWYILWSFSIFYGFGYIFYPFGMLYQEKSGNPVSVHVFCHIRPIIFCQFDDPYHQVNASECMLLLCGMVV
jgi:hypothetical protein